MWIKPYLKSLTQTPVSSILFKVVKIRCVALWMDDAPEMRRWNPAEGDE
jgi:hypothetical protein